MKKIAFFCIPAHGHTNPMLPVTAELVKRGHDVRFYSFDEFKEKIEATGAQYISCDRFLVPLTKRVSIGSIASAAACPFFSLYFFWGSLPGILLCSITGLTVVWAHRGNIRRLMDGTERRIGEKK